MVGTVVSQADTNVKRKSSSVVSSLAIRREAPLSLPRAHRAADALPDEVVNLREENRSGIYF